MILGRKYIFRVLPWDHLFVAQHMFLMSVSFLATWKRPGGHLASPPGRPGAQAHLAHLAISPPGAQVFSAFPWPTWHCRAHLATRPPGIRHLSKAESRRHVFLLNKKICLLVEQEDTSSCRTRRHVFLLNKNTRLLVEQEDMPSC